MLVHRRVTPSGKFASTHLYTWVERGTMRVKYLAQEHNAVPRPGLEPGPPDPESSALTITPPRLPQGEGWGHVLTDKLYMSTSFSCEILKMLIPSLLYYSRVLYFRYLAGKVDLLTSEHRLVLIIHLLRGKSSELTWRID